MSSFHRLSREQQPLPLFELFHCCLQAGLKKMRNMHLPFGKRKANSASSMSSFDGKGF
jgi:hypothetical protein